MHHRIASLATMLLCLLALRAQAGTEQGFQWDPWRHLPVLEGGRPKPFDTLAWETTRTLSNRAQMPDPESAQVLQPHTFYLAMLFEWPGWGQPLNPLAGASMAWRAEYYQMYPPDKWDRAPLLRVDFLALRDALGLAADQQYISPLDLSQAVVKSVELDDSQPFLRWAHELLGKQQDGLTTLEQKSLQLADKYWSYQDHRMGRRLLIVPAPSGDNPEWTSVAQLIATPWDDTTDPTGKLRQAKEQLQRARTAYFDSAAAEFNTASSAFIATVGELGRTAPAYPRQHTIDLEVTYNRWVPFRFAWTLMLAAFLCLLLNLATQWKLFYVSELDRLCSRHRWR